MFNFLLTLFLGVFLGWFFLPRPAWARTLLNALLAKVPFLAPFVKKDAE